MFIICIYVIKKNTAKSEKKKDEIYSKSFCGEYKVQQASSNKVGLDLSSEKNSLEEDPISTSLKDKPIFKLNQAENKQAQPQVQNILVICVLFCLHHD